MKSETFRTNIGGGNGKWFGWTSLFVSIVFSLSLALSGTWRGLNLFELTKTGFVFFLSDV
jgi:hypothetical protein